VETAREVEREFAADGRVAMVFIDFPIPSHGYPAMVSHEAAHCAGEQGRYWDMHDALFERQEALLALDAADEDAARRTAVAIGTGIGLDGPELETCLEGRRYRVLVASLFQQAREGGIDSTPTLMLRTDGETETLAGFLSFEELRPVLERMLSGATPTP
jgi:protein-disulfide isomerase